MADLPSHGKPDRDIEQALVALKRGTQLCKYSRKAKPKFCVFKLSTDETTLIWHSHAQERTLKLSSVSRIIQGQRTAVFHRYLRPEKDYLSFSLIYDNGERSLDLICKDPEEAEVWLTGLKALISRGKQPVRRTKSDLAYLKDGSELSYGRARSSTIELFNHSVAAFRSQRSVEAEYSNMQLRPNTGDGFRLSVSSTPSNVSGSGLDDIESLGDVYVWGELWSDGISSLEGSTSHTLSSSRVDILSPKPLESNVVLDVHQIACGVRHLALVTRQGEVFSWGEECGGRLGHGFERDLNQPHLVEYLAMTNVDYVSCGEFHSAAISATGEVFTWGDGTHNSGVLGHGTNASHWLPKRVSGPLEGLQVVYIACGTWHSGIITASGKLFTCGDGNFGVLGHGDRGSVMYPKEVLQLSGMKTIKVACGVWHTAAIVEVMGSRKLYTWGDGDKYRLGHGNKETCLVPTCVSALGNYNFAQIACGNTMTVTLTTCGHVFTMGGTTNGQLGNPQADGKSPCMVQDKLVGEFVEEISCGAYHVAVLTARSEVFTWGRGANGRLGHGDAEDRRYPNLVESLKDRHVKSISCGANFTTAICVHKWVSGADQSVCSGCRQAFGFTRKRHNCYNCGLVHCHACSSKKALKAALAPTPNKPHRVCDACYSKLKSPGAVSVSTTVNSNKRGMSAPLHTMEYSSSTTSSSRGDEAKSFRILPSPIVEPIRYLEVRSQGPAGGGSTSDSVSMGRPSQVPSLKQLKDISFPSSLTALQSAIKPVSTVPLQAPSFPGPGPTPTYGSRPASPYSRKPCSPRTGPSVLSRGVIASLKKSNELLSEEVAKLQNQVKTTRQRCKILEDENQKLQKYAKEAIPVPVAKSSHRRLPSDVVKSFITKLKEIREKMPADLRESQSLQALQYEVETFLNASDSSYFQYPWPLEGASNQQPNREMRRSLVIETSESAPSYRIATSSESSAVSSGRGNEVTELFEPGVYIVYKHHPNGAKEFVRVRFSKRRFSNHQAEDWWKANKDRVMRRYSSKPDAQTTDPNKGSATGEESSSSAAPSSES